MFDKGETFSGIPFELGVDAVEKLKAILPENMALTEMALKWILMKPEVSCIIPGASKVDQVHSNIKASNVPDLHPATLKKIDTIYHEDVKKHVHQLW
jgi:aryl-alcohol dehydrogenase-like predicted oxidoreductase